MDNDGISEVSPVLVVGRGLIGSGVQNRLRDAKFPVVCVARGPVADLGSQALDLSGEAGRVGLRALLDQLTPRCVVLTHGPSDVTWIEEHEREAVAVHCGVAEVLAGVPVPTVLVSTDNVFSGSRGGHRPIDEVQPGNAYGRVKARAEEILLAGGSALILRVSLVYGWTGPHHRSTYAERCLQAAFEGRLLLAPTDQVFTPIHVRDVADMVGALSSASGALTGVRHLAGPRELSRYDFASLTYRLAGADVDLVRPCLRRDTEWASRPRYSSLECSDFSDIPGFEDWCPTSPDDGLRAMLTERPLTRVRAR